MGEPNPPIPLPPSARPSPSPPAREDELIIDVDAVDEGASPDELVLPTTSSAVYYCPSWACPACLGPVKVSSFVRAAIVGVMVSVVVALFVLSLIPGSPVTGFIAALLQRINAVPFHWKLLAMWLFYLCSAPFGLPVTPLNLACGFLFGFVYGVLIAIVGTMLGSTICFIWGRTLLYSWAREQTEKRRLLQALTIAIRNQAVRLIALTHLSPILPATLLHYTYSAMGVPFVRFSWGTLLGILPFVVVYVYLGSVSKSLTSALADENTSWGTQLVWMAVIVVFSLVILAVVTWIAKRELNRAMAVLEGEDEDAHLENEEEMREFSPPPSSSSPRSSASSPSSPRSSASSPSSLSTTVTVKDKNGYGDSSYHHHHDDSHDDDDSDDDGTNKKKATTGKAILSTSLPQYPSSKGDKGSRLGEVEGRDGLSSAPSAPSPPPSPLSPLSGTTHGMADHKKAQEALPPHSQEEEEEGEGEEEEEGDYDLFPDHPLERSPPPPPPVSQPSHEDDRGPILVASSSSAHDHSLDGVGYARSPATPGDPQEIYGGLEGGLGDEASEGNLPMMPSPPPPSTQDTPSRPSHPHSPHATSADLSSSSPVSLPSLPFSLHEDGDGDGDLPLEEEEDSAWRPMEEEEDSAEEDSILALPPPSSHEGDDHSSSSSRREASRASFSSSTPVLSQDQEEQGQEQEQEDEEEFHAIPLSSPGPSSDTHVGDANEIVPSEGEQSSYPPPPHEDDSHEEIEDW